MNSTPGRCFISDHTPHDVQADEQDLLTINEAAARVRQELESARAELAALQAEPRGGSDLAARVDAVQARLLMLERAVSRYEAG